MRRLGWRILDTFTKICYVFLYPFKLKPFQIDQKKYWSQRAVAESQRESEVESYYVTYNQILAGRIGQLRDVLSILEVGCYRGERLAVIRDSFPTTHLVGCDLGANQLSLCQKLLEGQRVALVNADASRLPFESESFDLVLTSACLEHIPFSAISEVMHELTRVSRRYVLLVEAYIRHMPIRQKLRYVTINYFFMHNYEALMRRNGLTSVEILPLRDEAGYARYSLMLFSKETDEPRLRAVT